MLLHIRDDGIVGRIAHFYDKSCRLIVAIGGKALVAPANEVLGHKDCVEARTETHYTGWVLLSQAIARERDLQVNHACDTL